MADYGVVDDGPEQMDTVEDSFEGDELSTAENAHSIGANDFANALTTSLNAHTTNAQKLFGKRGLLSRFQRIAQERVGQTTHAQEALEWWTLESRFWDLFRRLYEFRWTRHQDQSSEETNASLEETGIILNWLMDHAPRSTDDEYIQSNRWMYTREDIKLRKLNPRQVPTNNTIITELDPDAPLRQGKTLHPDDEVPEQTLLKQIFFFIRRGDIKKAQEICRDANAHWRAASLSGVPEDGTTLNNGWRKACLQIARQGQVDRVERAIYGAICGDLDSVTAVCGTWEDQLWAHYNAIYTWKLEEKMRQTTGDSDIVVADFGGATPEDVLHRLLHSENDGVRTQANHPIRRIMGCIITGNLNPAIDYMLTFGQRTWAKGEIAILLRLSCHILLALRDLSVDHKEDAANEIIRQYVDALMEFHVNDHIALYAYHLPTHLGIQAYATFLNRIPPHVPRVNREDIEPDSQRLQQLENARKFNLDTSEIIRKTIQLTLSETQAEMEELYPGEGEPVNSVPLDEPIPPLDQTQIRAIEWVSLANADDLLLDTLVNGNIIFRRFLLAGHLNSVKALAERIPCNNLIRPDEIDTSDLLSQHALEYAQHSALWELFSSYDHWTRIALQYHHAHASRRDRLAEKQSKTDVRTSITAFISRARAMVLGDEGLNAVLDDVMRVEDPESYVTLAKIRDLYVPEIILRMHEVWVWGGENIDPLYLDDAFDLAAAVADVGSKLYECFRATNQLEDYLGKIKELSILSLKQDNLGTGIGAV